MFKWFTISCCIHAKRGDTLDFLFRQYGAYSWGWPTGDDYTMYYPILRVLKELVLSK
jgi:hypothetical protein